MCIKRVATVDESGHAHQGEWCYSIIIIIMSSHSAFLACSFRLGAVPSAVTFPCSISAAHNAAPTVLVKANRMEARGTISNNVAATP